MILKKPWNSKPFNFEWSLESRAIDTKDFVNVGFYERGGGRPGLICWPSRDFTRVPADPETNTWD